MKLSLQLKLGQQLTMTPQLQQAIRLLQLSTLDLQQEIHQALETNPMLELIEGNDDDEGVGDGDKHSEFEKLKADTAEPYQAGDSSGTEENQWQNEIPGDLVVDSNWDDIYPSSYTSSSSSSFDSDNYDFESRNSTEETLQDHLLWQLNLTPGAR